MFGGWGWLQKYNTSRRGAEESITVHLYIARRIEICVWGGESKYFQVHPPPQILFNGITPSYAHNSGLNQVFYSEFCIAEVAAELMAQSIHEYSLAGLEIARFSNSIVNEEVSAGHDQRRGHM